MTVFMTLKIDGDPKALEQYAKDNVEKFQNVLEAAKSHGLIAHRFYGSDDGGEVLVLDEWPDRESCEAFFTEKRGEIGPMFEAAGATGQPQPQFWQELVTGDAFGWGV